MSTRAHSRISPHHRLAVFQRKLLYVLLRTLSGSFWDSPTPRAGVHCGHAVSEVLPSALSSLKPESLTFCRIRSTRFDKTAPMSKINCPAHAGQAYYTKPLPPKAIAAKPPFLRRSAGVSRVRPIRTSTAVRPSPQPEIAAEGSVLSQHIV